MEKPGMSRQARVLLLLIALINAGVCLMLVMGIRAIGYLAGWW